MTIKGKRTRENFECDRINLTLVGENKCSKDHVGNGTLVGGVDRSTSKKEIREMTPFLLLLVDPYITH
jgi:hypothetical protein